MQITEINIRKRYATECKDVKFQEFNFRRYSDFFYHSAITLDDIATIANDSFFSDIKKPGAVQEIKLSTEQLKNRRDMDHDYVATYLYCQSIELLFKSALLKQNKKLEKTDLTHNTTKLFSKIALTITLSSENKKKANNLLKLVDTILLWAGRYPTDKPDYTVRAFEALQTNVPGYEKTVFCNNIPRLFHPHKEFYHELRSIIIEQFYKAPDCPLANNPEIPFS